MTPVKVVISLSTCASKLPAIGKSAFLTSSMRRAFEPPSATSAAARVASPSLPAGSWAEPTANSSLRLIWGKADFWRVSLSVPFPASGAKVASAGVCARSAASDPCERVVRTSLSSFT